MNEEQFEAERRLGIAKRDIYLQFPRQYDEVKQLLNEVKLTSLWKLVGEKYEPNKELFKEYIEARKEYNRIIE